MALASCLATCLAAGAGRAADMPMPMRAPPVEPVIPPPPAAWTGAYFGGSVGARATSPGWTTTGIQSAGFAAAPAAPDPSSATPSFNGTSLRAGVFYGYNWQIGPAFVVGLESDVAWGNNHTTITGIPGTYGSVLGGSAAAASDWTQVKEGIDTSSRLRIGYLITPSLLAFATGGVATQNVTVTAACSAAGPWCGVSRQQTDSWTQVGWTAGGGLEAMLGGGWLARAEYRYADFGTISNTLFRDSPDAINANLKIKTQTALIGLAYKLDPGFLSGIAGSVDGTAAPVMATKAPAAAMAWTGAYAGVTFGGRKSTADWTTTGVENPFGVGGGTAPDPSSAAASFDSTTLRAGGDLGYLWQLSAHWVLGTEADAAWGNGSKSVTGLPGTYGPGTGFAIGPSDSTSVKEGWDANYLTRVGYLVTPDVMLYGTAGTSFMQITAAAACTASLPTWCGANHSETDSWIKLGFVGGAGIEAALGGGWRARAEYRYADYGTITQTFFAGTFDSFSAQVRVKAQTGLLGVSYALGVP